MVVTFIQQRKKQKYFIIAFAIIFVISAVVLYFGYFKKEKPISPVIVSPVHFYREIKIDFGVLDNPLFKEFYPFEKISLPIEFIKGRENPFLPY